MSRDEGILFGRRLFMKRENRWWNENIEFESNLFIYLF